MVIGLRCGKGQSGLRAMSVSGAMGSEEKGIQKPHHLDNGPTNCETQAIGKILPSPSLIADQKKKKCGEYRTVFLKAITY